MATPSTVVAGAPWEHTLVGWAAPRARFAFRRFLMWFSVLPVLLTLAAFPLVRSEAYPHWREHQWGPLLDYAFAPGPQSADVVIFGDSSAFTGIDPRVINAQLGIRTIVLPATVGSLPITGDLALRRYLATHAKPKLIVFYFSPWDLGYQRARNVLFFEGQEMLFRHGSWVEIGAFVRLHPLETLLFPFRLYSTYGDGIFKSLLSPRRAVTSLAPSLGHMDDMDHRYDALKDDCKLPAQVLEDTDRSSVQALHAEYVASVRTLVYLAPMPACRNAGSIAQRSYASVDATPPVMLPPKVFAADVYYAHIEPTYVPFTSRMLGTAIQQQLASSAKAP